MNARRLGEVAVAVAMATAMALWAAGASAQSSGVTPLPGAIGPSARPEPVLELRSDTTNGTSASVETLYGNAQTLTEALDDRGYSTWYIEDNLRTWLDGWLRNQADDTLDLGDDGPFYLAIPSSPAEDEDPASLWRLRRTGSTLCIESTHGSAGVERSEGAFLLALSGPPHWTTDSEQLCTAE